MVEGLQGTSLFLVGMMGSGKSTVGRLVAKALSYCFFDTGAPLLRAMPGWVRQRSTCTSCPPVCSCM